MKVNELIKILCDKDLDAEILVADHDGNDFVEVSEAIPAHYNPDLYDEEGYIEMQDEAIEQDLPINAVVLWQA